MTADVLARGVCVNCLRPLALLAEIGWLHEDLPNYDHGPACPFPSPLKES